MCVCNMIPLRHKDTNNKLLEYNLMCLYCFYAVNQQVGIERNINEEMIDKRTGDM